MVPHMVLVDDSSELMNRALFAMLGGVFCKCHPGLIAQHCWCSSKLPAFLLYAHIVMVESQCKHFSTPVAPPCFSFLSSFILPMVMVLIEVHTCLNFGYYLSVQLLLPSFFLFFSFSTLINLTILLPQPSEGLQTYTLQCLHLNELLIQSMLLMYVYNNFSVLFDL